MSAVVTVLWVFCSVRLFCCQVYSVVLWCVLSGKVDVTISHTQALRQHGGGPRGASVSEGGGPSCRDRCFGTLCSSRKNIRGTIAGAQRIRGLWRVYPLTREARTSLLVSGVELHGQTVVCFDKNPYILRGGSEALTTKLYISDIPISVDDREIRNLLERLGCTSRSPLVSERARNKVGKLTRFLTGRRCFYRNTQLPVAAFCGGGPIQGHSLPQRNEIKRCKMRKVFANRPCGLNFQLEYSLLFLLQERTHGQRRKM